MKYKILCHEFLFVLWLPTKEDNQNKVHGVWLLISLDSNVSFSFRVCLCELMLKFEKSQIVTNAFICKK